MSLLLQIVAAGDTAANAANALTPANEQDTMTMWDLIMAGGPVMIPIFLCSLVAMYIIVERLIALNKISKDPSNFMNHIRDYITNGNIEAARALCRNTGTPVARMIEKGIARLGKPLPDIEKAIENVGNVEVVKMERGMSLLATAAGAAPMLGFLGTVTGMVRAFYDMNMEYQRTHENINIGVLASGMYEAMVTTVAGLIVGIVALVCYNLLSSMIKKILFRMESSSIEFLDLLEEPVRA